MLTRIPGPYTGPRNLPRPILLPADDPALVDAVPSALPMVWPDAPIVTAAPGTRHRAEDLRPAVILLDRDAAAGRGWALIPDLRPRGPPRLLVMSAAAAPAAIAQARDQGAADYLCKPFRPLELLARLQALRRRPPLPPAIPAAVVQIGAVGVAGAHGDIRGAGEPRARTPTA